MDALHDTNVDDRGVMHVQKWMFLWGLPGCSCARSGLEVVVYGLITVEMQGDNIENDEELTSFISESSTMSKSLDEYDGETVNMVAFVARSFGVEGCIGVKYLMSLCPEATRFRSGI